MERDDAFADAVERVARAVRFDAGDLAGSAGRLFERLRTDDRAVQLGLALAADGSGHLPPAFVRAAAQIEDSGGGASDPDTFDAPELLGYVVAVVVAELLLPGHADPQERRARVEEAVRRIVGHHT